MSALGQKRTYAVQQPMSALLSIATAKADSCKKAMSALPPKADMCGATRDVRFVPKADIQQYSGCPPSLEEMLINPQRLSRAIVVLASCQRTPLRTARLSI